MRVDYRRFSPGVALAAKMFVSRCPVCGEGCVKREMATGYQFHHAAEITPSHVHDTKVEVTEMCKQTKEEHKMRPTYPEKP